MKAVYEMPRVSFEAFAAENAVATGCGANTELLFDCLKGPETDTTSVLSDAIQIKSCSVQAGFADYNGQTTTDTEKDDISSAIITGDFSKNYSKNAAEYLEWTLSDETGKDKVAVKQSFLDSFLGWLYIGSNGRNNKGTFGWTIVDGVLKMGGSWKHQNFAPVFGLAIQTSL